MAFPLKEPQAKSEKVTLYRKNKNQTKQNDTNWKHKKKSHALLSKFTVERDIGSKFNTTTEKYSHKNTLCIIKVSNELFSLFPFAVSTHNDDLSNKLLLLSSCAEIFGAGKSIDNNYQSVREILLCERIPSAYSLCHLWTVTMWQDFTIQSKQIDQRWTLRWDRLISINWYPEGDFKLRNTRARGCFNKGLFSGF